MPFEDVFEDDFRNFGTMNRRTKKLRDEIDALFERMKTGELEGTWETREINEPGLRGRISIGRFESDRELEPLDPMKPQRKRPMPELSFELPKNASEETREPLTDIFKDDNALTIYVELPGEEKENIQLKLSEGSLDIRARNFRKTIDLPENDIAAEKMTTEYKNGVLKITLPKKTTLRPEDIERQKHV